MFRWSALAALLTLAAAACADRANAPAPLLGVTLGTPAPSLSVVQGDRTSIPVTITRAGGFAGSVTLGVTGAPAGITASIAANPVSGDEAALDLTVGDDVAAGEYQLAVNATANGLAAKALALDLEVVARQAVDVSVPWCSGIEPSWVAFQDGGGAWAQALPEVHGAVTSFHHVFSANRGAIATLDRLGNGTMTSLRVFYGAPAELVAVGDTLAANCGFAAGKTMFGTVTPIDENSFVAVSSGQLARAIAPSSLGNAFALRDLPSGPQDLLAARITSANDVLDIPAMILRRNIDVPDSTRIPLLDFTSAEAFAPVKGLLTVSGLGGDAAFHGTELRTSHSRMIVFFATTQSTATTRTIFELPESQLRAGDLQVLHVSAIGASGNRTVDQYFRTPGDRGAALGASLVAPVITRVATTPSPRLRARFIAQADYDRATNITYQQGQSTLVTISLTGAYAAASGAGYDLVVPDLSNAAGFDPAWALRPDGMLWWSATRVGGTLALGIGAPGFDGAIQRASFLMGSLSAP